MSSSSASASSEENSSLLERHLERQTKILQSIVGKNDPRSEEEESSPVLDLGYLLEKNLFAPADRVEKQQGPDPKLNFYPPFLTPECLALHYPFFLTTSIPRSCKANRTGTDTYRHFSELSHCLEVIPSPDSWNDALGNVALIQELKENQKLALLECDSPRLAWLKSKCGELKNYAYPALAFPPVIQKALFNELIGRTQEPNDLDAKYELAFGDDDLPQETQAEKLKQRETIGAAATFGALLLSMQRLFTHPTVVKNTQEALHYTFLHGYVRMVHLLTEVNMSEFVTYHGLTHRNRLNNPVQHRQLDGQDRYDYIVDTIYLYLVFSWQTAMDIWGQTIDDETKDNLTERIVKIKPELTQADYSRACALISEAVFPDLLKEALVVNIPDFVNQTQLSNFRLFINNKSNVPSAVCPALPSDFVPLSFDECHPVLWCHVFLLRHAAFLQNHGGYADAPDDASVSTALCECNLCAPHRMPCYNAPLLNEIMSIGKFGVQGPEDRGQFSLTPQVFANAYMKKFYPEDYHPHAVVLYKDDRSEFKTDLTAAVVRDEKLLALMRESQMRREKNILKRGGGLYLDPQTGEVLGRSGHGSAEEELQAGAGGEQEPGHAVPHHESGGRQPGRGLPPVGGGAEGIDPLGAADPRGESHEQPGRGVPERGRARKAHRGRGGRRATRIATPAPAEEKDQQEKKGTVGTDDQSA